MEARKRGSAKRAWRKRWQHSDAPRMNKRNENGPDGRRDCTMGMKEYCGKGAQSPRNALALRGGRNAGYRDIKVGLWYPVGGGIADDEQREVVTGRECGGGRSGGGGEAGKTPTATTRRQTEEGRREGRRNGWRHEEGRNCSQLKTDHNRR